MSFFEEILLHVIFHSTLLPADQLWLICSLKNDLLSDNFETDIINYLQNHQLSLTAFTFIEERFSVLSAMVHWWKSRALRENPCVINLDTSLFPRAWIDKCKESTEKTRMPSSICCTVRSIWWIRSPAVLRFLLKLAVAWHDFRGWWWPRYWTLFILCLAYFQFSFDPTQLLFSFKVFFLMMHSDPQLSLKCLSCETEREISAQAVIATVITEKGCGTRYLTLLISLWFLHDSLTTSKIISPQQQCSLH